MTLIKSDGSVLATDAKHVFSHATAEYTAYTLNSLGGVLNVPGSHIHDQHVAHALYESLQAWEGLLKKDADNLVKMGSLLEERDRTISKQY